MKLGLCSFAYRWAIGRPYYRPKHNMDLYTFVDRVKGFGLDHLIFCNNCELKTYSREALEKLDGHCRRQGMQVELGARETQPEEMLRMLDITKLFGARVLRLVYDAPEPMEKPAYLRALREFVGAVLPAAEEMGISLALENGPGLLHGDIIGTIEHFASPCLGACLDSMNGAYAVYRPEEVFSALAPYAKTVHLKDFAVVPNKRGYVISGVAMGEGMVDFPTILGYLTDAGYKGSAYIELYIDRKQTEKETLEHEEACVEKSVAYALGLEPLER